MTRSEALIEARHLARYFVQEAGTVAALSDATLRLGEGEFLALTGPSGSGKSTLLNLLGLLDRPSSGKLQIAGEDAATLSERERTRLRAVYIGFVFQLFHLVDYLTVRENVELGFRYQAASATGASLARECLERVGLGQRIEAQPRTLSGGERQRVAIARALASQPRLLLCDEPTGNLDGWATTGVLELLADLHDEGLTVLVVTHDPYVASCAEREVSMANGVLGSAR